MIQTVEVVASAAKACDSSQRQKTGFWKKIMGNKAIAAV